MNEDGEAEVGDEMVVDGHMARVVALNTAGEEIACEQLCVLRDNGKTHHCHDGDHPFDCINHAGSPRGTYAVRVEDIPRIAMKGWLA